MAEDLAQVLALLTQLSSQIKRTEDDLAALKAAKSEQPAEKKAAVVSTDPAVQALLDEYRAEAAASKSTVNKFLSEQRQEKLIAAAKEGLLKRGFGAKKVDTALKVVESQLKADKTGKFTFIDSQLGEIDLDEGLNRFAESETGGIFKDPIDIQGTGTNSFQANPLIPGQFQKRTPGFDPSKAKLKEDGTMEDNDFIRLIASTVGIQ